MLDRDEEQLMAGSRPSFFGNIKVAAKKDGTLTGYQSETWSTGGPSGRGVTAAALRVRSEEQQDAAHQHRHATPARRGPGALPTTRRRRF